MAMDGGAGVSDGYDRTKMQAQAGNASKINYNYTGKDADILVD